MLKKYLVQILVFGPQKVVLEIKSNIIKDEYYLSWDDYSIRSILCSLKAQTNELFIYLANAAKPQIRQN